MATEFLWDSANLVPLFLYKNAGVKVKRRYITEIQKVATKVAIVTVTINTLLAIFKLVAGIVSNSGAMISDAIHSAADVFSTIIVVIGIKAANREADKRHPYGHERIECVAAIVLATILTVTGVSIGISGIEKIADGIDGNLQVPGNLALIAAIVSIVVKEIMFRYTSYNAKKIKSEAMMADAWHNRSDALSSVASLVGIAGAMLGFPILDPIASVVICLFILRATFHIGKDALNKMIDTACDDEVVEKMKQKILEVDGVLSLDELKTRLFGDKIYIDVEISCDGDSTLRQSHDVAENVHHYLEQSFENVKHCSVHVNPK